VPWSAIRTGNGEVFVPDEQEGTTKRRGSAVNPPPERVVLPSFRVSFLLLSVSFLPLSVSFLPLSMSLLSKHVVPPSERGVPRSERFVPRSERFVPPSERIVPPSERVVPPSERVVPPSERVVPEPAPVVSWRRQTSQDGIFAAGKRRAKHAKNDLGVLRGELAQRGDAAQYKSDLGGGSAAPCQDHYQFATGLEVTDAEFPKGRKVFVVELRPAPSGR